MAPQHSESITVKSQYPQSSREARPKLAPQHCEATTKATPRCIHRPRSPREARPKAATNHLRSHYKNHPSLYHTAPGPPGKHIQKWHCNIWKAITKTLTLYHTAPGPPGKHVQKTTAAGATTETRPPPAENKTEGDAVHTSALPRHIRMAQQQVTLNVTQSSRGVRLAGVCVCVCACTFVCVCVCVCA